MEKLVVQNLCKVFGKKPEDALVRLHQGVRKECLLKDSGNTVGVYDINFSVKEGEIFVIMGLSGSGKSTLIRMLNRLIDPTEGSVIIDGVDISKMPDKTLRAFRQQKISMVFQSFALMPHMTVLDNVAFGLELAGVSEKIRHEKASKAIAQMGLSGYHHSYPDELSGGMKQRVGLARALACDTDIILMDEAFSALDPIIRSAMQDEILQLQQQYQKTLVFISHDIREAVKISSRMAILDDGCLVQVGTPEEILYHPANDYVRQFFQELSIDEMMRLREKHPANSALVSL